VRIRPTLLYSREVVRPVHLCTHLGADPLSRRDLFRKKGSPCEESAHRLQQYLIHRDRFRHVAHCVFSPALQFVMTMIGIMLVCPTSCAAMNPWPSAVTS
jgi:hypothetical protein